jgi:hypothetical protein
MFGPACLSEQLVNRLNADGLAAIRRADVTARIRTLGFDRGALPLKEFRPVVAKEMETRAPS